MYRGSDMEPTGVVDIVAGSQSSASGRSLPPPRPPKQRRRPSASSVAVCMLLGWTISPAGVTEPVSGSIRSSVARFVRLS